MQTTTKCRRGAKTQMVYDEIESVQHRPVEQL